MSKAVKVTVVFIVATVLSVILFDIVMASISGRDATISDVITHYSHIYEVIPFAFGFLMGHFFGQNSSPT